MPNADGGLWGVKQIVVLFMKPEGFQGGCVFGGIKLFRVANIQYQFYTKLSLCTFCFPNNVHFCQNGGCLVKKCYISPNFLLFLEWGYRPALYQGEALIWAKGMVIGGFRQVLGVQGGAYYLGILFKVQKGPPKLQISFNIISRFCTL